MEKMLLALGAVVAFILPLGIYCLMLASVNRRPRPTIVSGVLDSIGLLFAASGFLLITAPMLSMEIYRRTVEAADVDHVFEVWARQWLFSLVYYFLVACGSILLMLSRSNKTMIYNVDLEVFSKLLERALARLGLESQQAGKRLVVTPAKALVGVESAAFTEAGPRPNQTASDHRHAEVEIEAFPAMCHATLHWGRCTPGVRQQIEMELEKNLENAAPLENASAGWFLSASGLILGAAAAIAIALAFVAVITRR